MSLLYLQTTRLLECEHVPVVCPIKYCTATPGRKDLEKHVAKCDLKKCNSIIDRLEKENKELKRKIAHSSRPHKRCRHLSEIEPSTAARSGFENMDASSEDVDLRIVEDIDEN